MPKNFALNRQFTAIQITASRKNLCLQPLISSLWAFTRWHYFFLPNGYHAAADGQKRIRLLLAGKSLPWWAIGASLIAANISAEQIIGMSGSGYAIGLAIASYEWMAAITLILVGKYLLPVFLRAEIYTMPQFLQQRYDHRVRLVMAFFWLGVYVLVNLTSVLWLGALAINTVAGVELNLACCCWVCSLQGTRCTEVSGPLR